MIGAIILISSILGGSSIGTIANFISVKGGFAKNAWRNGIVACIFFIPAIIEFLVKRKETDYSNILSLKNYGLLLAANICQVLWTFGLVYASLNTI